MADNPQTTADLIMAQTYAPLIVRQINRKTNFIRTVPIVTGEGPNCAFAVEKGGALAEEYNEGADVVDYGSDGQDDAVLQWAQMRANSRITGLAQATSRTSKSPAGNIALRRRNIINSSAALASLINLRCFSGSGAGSPKQITGLDVAIGDDANTYGTIDRSDSNNAFWRPTIIDPGTPQPLTFANIRDDQMKIEIKCGQKPELAWVSPAVFNVVAGLFDSNRMFVDTLSTARGDVTLRGGSAIDVEGTVFVKDKDATDNRIYYCNTEYMALEVVPPTDEVVPQFQKGTVLTANDGWGEVPLMFNFEQLAKTGDSDKYFAKWYGELKILKPNAFGVRKNVKTAA